MRTILDGQGRLKEIGFVPIPLSTEAPWLDSLSDGKAQQWRQRFVCFEKSRQSTNAFCRQEGVSPQSFYLWRKRLAQSPADGQAPLPLPAGFRPVRLLPSASVSVQLPGGTQLVVPTTDAQSLQLVIETLARVDAQRQERLRPC